MAAKRKAGEASLDQKEVGDKKGKAQPLDYTWEQLHEDVNAGKFAGVYGGCNSAWHGLAAIRANVDLKQFHKKRSPDEFILSAFEKHIANKENQKNWSDIVVFDPKGLVSKPPTMAATEYKMRIPELENKLTTDGKVVNADGSINGVKLAVDYVWNVAGVAQRLKMDETLFRSKLAEYTNDQTILKKEFKTYFPPLGGFTVYAFGDLTKMGNKHTEIAVRVHDSCCGSDVFGTDICTCRPYLIFAIQAAVECAQRGGIGYVIYFQKEGRSLGEVTKYRVYNARKAQEGGDRPEKYFYQTEAIAGIRDARFQEMMPDILYWLGVKRIDWLLSMSSDKYDAIVERGIEVQQRVALPDIYVPPGAEVEITAKISAGYHTESVVKEDVIGQLRKLEMIRVRCGKVFDLAKEDKTRHFKLDLAKLDPCVDYVIKITKQNYPDIKTIPYHSRWRHFDEDRVAEIVASWPCSPTEKFRRKIDLCFVSVLLDAGAGNPWKFINRKGQVLNRSEGLAHASLQMFEDGIFSSDVALPHRANSLGLANVTLKQLKTGFQVTDSNPLVGVKERLVLLQSLGKALDDHPEFFGSELPRPGNLVDYLQKHVVNNRVSIKVLWKAIIEGLEKVWPENMAGVRRGDVWTYSPLKEIGHPASDLVPFHKLSQWLTYSLLEPFEQSGIQFDDLHLLTGLAEYRNGGLLIDFGVITPRSPDALGMEFDIGSEFLVEMRALTVCLMDEIADRFRKKLGLTKEQFGLAKVLQGGTWAAGRAIAAEKRPADKSPPIKVRSNGNIF